MPKTVLIVEDNELNMKLFRDLLEAHGIGSDHACHTECSEDNIKNTLSFIILQVVDAVIPFQVPEIQKKLAPKLFKHASTHKHASNHTLYSNLV